MITNLGQSQILGSAGAYGWSGAASTHFWVDPQEQLIGIQMAQFQPSGFHAIANDFCVAAYRAIVD
jgi:CubicO group peptidase (beta-lactamase class C family)